MNKDLYVKLIIGVTLITSVFFALRYRTNYLILFISLVSGIIQFVLFMVWFLEDQTILKNVDVKVEEVIKYVVKKDKNNIYREKVLRKIINKGLIDKKEIRNMIASIEKQDLILISLSECKIPKGLQNDKINSYPLRCILSKIGFSPIFYSFNPNIYFTFKKDLPKDLRNINQLDIFISHELKKTWEEIRKNAQKDFPNKFDKWKSSDGFKSSYILLKSFENDFKVVFKNKHTFSEEFLTRIIIEAKQNNIEKIIQDKIQVREIISKISIEILLDQARPLAKNKLVEKETLIKKNLNINSFLDFRKIQEVDLTTELKKYISETDSEKCSKIIINECKKVYVEIDSMGLLL